MADVILADDNLMTQRVFELALEGEDIRLSRFSSAQAVLDFALDHPPDIVFTHVGIPEIGGYELSRRLKSQPENEDVTVVMLVGAFQTFDAEKAAECGCVHQLPKPFETSVLLRLIKELLENPPRVALPKARFQFEIPLTECVPQSVFGLTHANCSAVPARPERELRLPDSPDFAALAKRFQPGFGVEETESEPSGESGATPSGAA